MSHESKNTFVVRVTVFYRLTHSTLLCSEPRASARADALDNSNVQPAENRYTKREYALEHSLYRVGSRERSRSHAVGAADFVPSAPARSPL